MNRTLRIEFKTSKATTFIIVSMCMLGIVILQNVLSFVDIRSRAAMITFTPSVISYTTDEIPNPGRGLYKWIGQRFMCPPASSSNQESYRRFAWKDLETSQGVYDWSKVRSFLDNAQQQEQRAIVGLAQSSLGGNSGYIVPSYLFKEGTYGVTTFGTYLLNYNNTFVQSRLEALLDSFNQNFGNDKRMYMVQMLAYGQYGEGYIPWNAPASSPVWISDTNAEWLINSYHNRFSGKFLLDIPAFNKYLFKYAMTKEPKWGWGRMSFGDIGQMNGVTSIMNSTEVVHGVTIGTAVRNRWKYAPVWAETIGHDFNNDYANHIQHIYDQVKEFHVSLVGNGNFDNQFATGPWDFWNEQCKARIPSSGWTQSNINTFTQAGKIAGYRYAVTSFVMPGSISAGSIVPITSVWTNNGVAPTYDSWEVLVQLRNNSGVSWQQKLSSIDLKAIMPADSITTAIPTPVAKQLQDSVTIPQTLAPGLYAITLLIKDPTGKMSKPLNLAINGRQNDGSYQLGTIQITAPAATPTQIPNSEVIKATVSVLLHGIGKGGDNVNANGSGNSSPVHTERQVSIEIFDSANQSLGQKLGTILFVPDKGGFEGHVDLGVLLAGNYSMKMKVPHYLQKIVPGIITIAAGPTITFPTVALVAGDVNADNALSILDYNMLLDCFSDLSPAKNCADPAKKQATDINDDGNVNQFDYNLFLRELSTQSGQ